jgi:hypothetical protein
MDVIAAVHSTANPAVARTAVLAYLLVIKNLLLC